MCCVLNFLNSEWNIKCLWKNISQLLTIINTSKFPTHTTTKVICEMTMLYSNIAMNRTGNTVNSHSFKQETVNRAAALTERLIFFPSLYKMSYFTFNVLSCVLEYILIHLRSKLPLKADFYFIGLLSRITVLVQENAKCILNITDLVLKT